MSYISFQLGQIDIIYPLGEYGNNWLIIHVLAKIFSAFPIVGYLIVSLHTDKSYFLQKNNFDLLKSEHHLKKWKLNWKGQRRLPFEVTHKCCEV